MKKILTSNTEKTRILQMHGFLREQVQPSETEEQVLDRARKQGCIAKYTWFTPDEGIRRTKSGKSVITGKGSNGNTYYFYGDMNIVNANTGAKKTWTCEKINTTSLNDNQRVSLKQLSDIGWFSTPKPTDVELDMGLYRKINLSDGEPNETTMNPEEFQIVKTYNKYFMTDYPKGTNDFYVYKKTVTQPKAPGKIEKVETPGKSCKTSIENLYKHMDSPNTFPMTDNEKRADVLIAQRCAESANKKRFLLRFGLDKKLQLIAREYGIKLS
jgi:hypothetical protein